MIGPRSYCSGCGEVIECENCYNLQQEIIAEEQAQAEMEAEWEKADWEERMSQEGENE